MVYPRYTCRVTWLTARTGWNRITTCLQHKSNAIMCPTSDQAASRHALASIPVGRSWHLMHKGEGLPTWNRYMVVKFVFLLMCSFGVVKMKAVLTFNSTSDERRKQIPQDRCLGLVAATGAYMAITGLSRSSSIFVCFVSRFQHQFQWLQ